jgi:hypothetical protein
MGSRGHNPEKRRKPMGWRGRSYKKGGAPVVELRADVHAADGPEAIAAAADEAVRAVRRGDRIVIAGDVMRQLSLVDRKLLLLTGVIDRADYEGLILDEQAERGDHD